MRVAILAEKPTLFREMVPAVETHFAPTWHRDSVASICYPFHTVNGSFLYPRGLRWADYPFSGEVSYRPVELTGSTAPYFGTGIQDHPFERVPTTDRGIEEETLARIRKADLIVSAYDSDHTGCHGLKRVLDHAFPDGLPRDRVVISRIRSMDLPGLASSLANPMDESRFQEFVSMGEIRRRFDFGFNVNALALFRRVMQRIGIADDLPVPSKYAVQFLYFIRSVGALSDARVLAAMSKWKGTGAYSGKSPSTCDSGFGSPASRASIIDMLQRSGLIEQVAEPDERKPHRTRHRLSDLGARFLDNLHPRCEDPDLCFRLTEWASLPTEQGFEKVDRYLRTYFGRQKRFLTNAPGAISD